MMVVEDCVVLWDICCGLFFLVVDGSLDRVNLDAELLPQALASPLFVSRSSDSYFNTSVCQLRTMTREEQ